MENTAQNATTTANHRLFILFDPPCLALSKRYLLRKWNGQNRLSCGFYACI
jgi:hypothetical protein